MLFLIPILLYVAAAICAVLSQSTTEMMLVVASAWLVMAAFLSVFFIANKKDVQ